MPMLLHKSNNFDLTKTCACNCSKKQVNMKREARKS